MGGVSILIYNSAGSREDLPLGNNSPREMHALIKDRLRAVQTSDLAGYSDHSERAAAAVCLAYQLRDQLRWQAFGTLYRSYGLGSLETEYFKDYIYARTSRSKLCVSQAFLIHYGLAIEGDSICVFYRPQV